MSTIKLSPRSRREFCEALMSVPWEGRFGARLERLYSILHVGPAAKRSPKVAEAKRERVAKKAAKRLAHADETAAIYREVEKRADGKCEACGRPFSPGDPPELDHALGRGKARQSVRNTWLCHRSCHRARHAGRPSSAYWHGLFAVHCDRHGYHREAADARAKFEADSLVEQAAEVSNAR